MSDTSTPESGAPAVDVNSVRHTLRMAVLLCLVCSVLVSAAAVGLRGIQEKNRDNFRKENILKAAGLWDDDGGSAQIGEKFKQVTAVVLDFESATAGEDAELAIEINKTIRKAIKDPTKSDEIEDDIAGIKRREKQTVIYTVAKNGKTTTVILPIRGYGLWSTLWGFIALDVSQAEAGPDQIFIQGLTYFEQKETPGLGGEVDNPRWKSKWAGKKAYDADWNVKIAVEKGAAGIYEVDALSGATITSRGVSNMLKYWLSEEGFRPYLKELSGVPTGNGSSGSQAASENHGGGDGQHKDEAENAQPKVAEDKAGEHATEQESEEPARTQGEPKPEPGVAGETIEPANEGRKPQDPAKEDEKE